MHQVGVSDAAQLAAMGYVSELPRNLSPVSMLGMAFAILNSWSVLSASLSLSLSSGGPTAAVWGLVSAGICNLCLAASLAEFLSAYPTAGGQYHWVGVIAPRAYATRLAWLTGWITVFGWIAVTASGSLLGSQLVVGIIASNSANHQPRQVEEFLLYISFTLIAFVVNYWMNSILPSLSKIAFLWSVLGFVGIPVTVLALNDSHYADPSFVFGYFINMTGWPDGIAWLLGLLSGSLGLNGYDAVAHMIEEIPNASVEGPKIMVLCVALGIFTGFIFLLILLFVSGGADAIDDIIRSPAGPLLEILCTSTRSRIWAACLLMFPLFCLLFGTISIMTTSSRMVYAFARDGGLPASSLFARVHQRRGMPLNALCLTTAITITFGCVFVISSAAFNAISSASVVALSISYALPIAVNCAQGRRKLPARVFALPRTFAWLVNIIGVFYSILTSILFLLPPKIPVNSVNMNYGGVALILVLLVSAITWIFHGRKHYRGPALLQYDSVRSSDSTDSVATQAIGHVADE